MGESYRVILHGPLGQPDVGSQGAIESLNPEMTIETFKRLILNLTGNNPFFLKFNLDNDKKLQDLIDQTVAWYAKMENWIVGNQDKDHVILDIYQDRDNFDLWFEYIECKPFLDSKEKDMEVPQYIQLKGLHDNIKISPLLKKLRDTIKEKTGTAYLGKLTIKLPDDRILNNDLKNKSVVKFQRDNSLRDLGINRFTPLRFYNPGTDYKDDVPMPSAKFLIHFPEYLVPKQSSLQVAFGMTDNKAAKIVELCLPQIDLPGKSNHSYRMYTLGNICAEIDNDELLSKHCRPLKNLCKASKDEFLFDLKDVIVIRLFASDKFVLIKFDKSIKSIAELANSISWDDLKDASLSTDVNAENFKDNLVFSFNGDRLLVGDDLQEKLPHGPSSNLQLNVMVGGFTWKQREYLSRSEDAKWMSMELISSVGPIRTLDQE